MQVDQDLLNMLISLQVRRASTQMHQPSPHLPVRMLKCLRRTLRRLRSHLRLPARDRRTIDSAEKGPVARQARRETPDTTSKLEGKALKTSGLSSQASESDALQVGANAFDSAQSSEQH